MSTSQLTRMKAALAHALSVEEVNQLGRDTGQSVRLRTVTPHRLFLAIVAALAGAKVESLADLLREFNHQNDVTVAYKAFYNRLARAGFAEFMQQMFMRLLMTLSVRTLKPEGGAAIARFKDIVIQDGSSFAVKHKLRDAFPGRFTAIEPAAVGCTLPTADSATTSSPCSWRPIKKLSGSFCPTRRTCCTSTSSNAAAFSTTPASPARRVRRIGGGS